MVTGKVRMWSKSGYGFIVPDAGGVDLFVHINNCSDGLDALLPGTRVSYERESRKKPGSYEAIDVMVI